MKQTKIGTLHMSEAQILDLKQKKEKVCFGTHLPFLVAHKGIRRANLHTFLGSTGAGKTTLNRTVVYDFLCNAADDTKILVWLSEESIQNYQTEMAQLGVTEQQAQRVTIISELELGESASFAPRMYFDDIIKSMKFDIVLFDNITTSRMYMDRQISVQSEFCNYLKNLAVSKDLAIMIFAHTRAEVNRYLNRIVNENDIRGCKTIVNLTEFLYIIQQFNIGSHIVQTIRIEKHRGQYVEDSLFCMDYDKDKSIYWKGCPVNFEEFKRLFEQRNKLGSN